MERERSSWPVAGEDPLFRRLFDGGLLYLLATSAPLVATVLVTPILTRALPLGEYAVIATCLVVVQVTALVVGLGLPAAITRHVVIESGGLAAARGLVHQGAVLAAVLAAAGAVSAPLWVRPALGYDWRPAPAFAVAAGLGTAIAFSAQAVFRGTGQVARFVTTAVAMTFTGQGLGIGGAILFKSAEGYVLGVMAGTLLSGVASAAVASRPLAGSPYGYLRAALRLSLPTLPHAVSFYLVNGSLLLIAAHRLSLPDAGKLQLALVVGTVPSLLLYSFNNAWAPFVYRASRETRGGLLGRTAESIAWVMCTVSAVVAAVAPVILAILAPERVLGREVYVAASLLACTGVLAVWYLANAHLIFAEGRTGGLAAVTPTSLCCAVAFALVVAEWRSVAAMAVVPIVFFVVQSCLMSLLRRRVSSTIWSERKLLAPTMIGVLLCVAAAAAPVGNLGTLARFVVALSLGGVMAVQVLRRSRLR